MKLGNRGSGFRLDAGAHVFAPCDELPSTHAIQLRLVGSLPPRPYSSMHHDRCYCGFSKINSNPFTPSWEHRTAQHGYLNVNPSSRWPSPSKTRFLSQINSRYHRWENHVNQHSLAYRARSGHSLLPFPLISFSVLHDRCDSFSPQARLYFLTLQAHCKGTVQRGYRAAKSFDK